MNLSETLRKMPVGKWSRLNTTQGVVEIYHCDCDVDDWYIVEGPGRRKSRLVLNKAVKFLYPLIDEDLLCQTKAS